MRFFETSYLLGDDDNDDDDDERRRGGHAKSSATAAVPSPKRSSSRTPESRGSTPIRLMSLRYDSAVNSQDFDNVTNIKR